MVSDEREAEPAGRDSGGLAPSDASWGLAFAAAAGVLMIQGSQQALAGTQFMGLQPPADLLGDLGDISTGFASVRRTASDLNLVLPFISVKQVHVVYISDAVLVSENQFQAFLLIFFSELGDRTFFIAVSISMHTQLDYFAIVRIFRGFKTSYTMLACMFYSANYMLKPAD